MCYLLGIKNGIRELGVCSLHWREGLPEEFTVQHSSCSLYEDYLKWVVGFFGETVTKRDIYPWISLNNVKKFNVFHLLVVLARSPLEGVPNFHEHYVYDITQRDVDPMQLLLRSYESTEVVFYNQNHGLQRTNDARKKRLLPLEKLTLEQAIKDLNASEKGWQINDSWDFKDYCFGLVQG